MRNIFTKTLLVIITSVFFLSAAKAQDYQFAPVFGNNGFLNPVFPSFAEGMVAKAHAIQPDGKILLAGTYNQVWNSYGVGMVRFDPVCGLLDSSFANGGILTQTFWGRSTCHDIALQSDGKIVGCGVIAPDNSGSQQWGGIFRFYSDGSVDSTFSGMGWKTDDIDEAAGVFYKVFVDDLDRIYILGKGGTIYNRYMTSFRYLPDGTTDYSYGVNGKAMMPFDYYPSVNSLTGFLHPDGSVTIAGEVSVYGSEFTDYHVGMVRFTPDGLPDESFGINGKALLPSVLMHSNNTGPKQMDMDILSDNRIVISYGEGLGGWPNQFAALAVVLPNGTVDTSFGENGIYRHTQVNSQGGGVHVLADDKILMFYTHHSNNGPGAVLRLLPDGTLDSTFGNEGVLLASASPQVDYRWFNDGFVLDDGSIIGYGSIGYAGLTAARFTPNIATYGLPVVHYEDDVLTTTTIGSYQWNLNDEPIEGATENTYTPTESGDYTLTIQYAAGCEFTSLPTTVCFNSSAVDVQNACNSFTWIDGNTYTSNNNIATHTLNNAMGCDSIVTLNLTIHTADLSVTQSANTLTANASNATYQWLDCDNNNASISGATSQSYTPISTGNYAVSITTANCSGISECSQITVVSVDELESKNVLSVYPNPVSDLLNVSFSNDRKPKHLILTDAMGRTVYSSMLIGSSGIITLDMNGYESGLYVLSIAFENGYIQSHQIVKL